MKFSFKKKIRTKEDKIQIKRNLVYSIASGLLLAWGFSPFPFPFTILLFFALVPLLFVYSRSDSLKRINLFTYLTGFVFSLSTLYWVGSWQEKADPFLMISGVLLVFVNPLFFLIPSTLFYYSRKIFSKKIYPYLLLPFFWVFYEYLYMITDASFPWLVLGNGLAKYTTFIQIADIIGAPGLTLIIVLFNSLIYLSSERLKQKEKSGFIYAGVLFLIYFIIMFYGNIRISDLDQNYEVVKAGVIQPNLDPWEKWQSKGMEELLSDYISLSNETIRNGAEILIFPETAFPVYLFSGRYSLITDSLYKYLKAEKLSLISGMPHLIYYSANDTKPYDVKYNKAFDRYYATYNSIMCIDPNNPNVLQWYGKSKLVPFGERVPFVDQLPFLGDWIKWGVGISGWNKGTEVKLLETMANGKKVKITGAICYESIYPYYVSEFSKLGSNLILVVTNDSWYGNSSGPYQHKDFAILRAIENRKSVVRAANGGISCYIDLTGKVINSTEMFTRSSKVFNVNLNSEITLFVKYGFIIPLIVSLISIATIIVFIIKKISGKRDGKNN